MKDENIVVVGGSGKTEGSVLDRLAAGYGSTSIEDIFDSQMWIEYLFDISWSMDDSIRKYSPAGKFEWTEEKTAEARKKLLEAIELENQFGSAPLPEDGDEEVDEDSLADEGLKPSSFNPQNDHDCWMAAVTGIIGMELPPLRPDAEVKGDKSKVEIMRLCAQSFLKKRFEKFPNAKVGVMVFGDKPTEVVAGADLEETARIIDMNLGTAHDGSTKTYKALRHALAKVRKARGESHHFILITDGLANDVHEESDFDDLIPLFKDRKVVLDVIFITTDGWWESQQPTVLGLKKVAGITGGSVQFVDNEQEFSQKFLKVSERKLLGTGGYSAGSESS